jgi:hypothetical protein
LFKNGKSLFFYFKKLKQSFAERRRLCRIRLLGGQAEILCQPSCLELFSGAFAEIEIVERKLIPSRRARESINLGILIGKKKKDL